ncbi:MAG: aminopeptidase P family protein, partial [Gemmatimonadota bacterium]
MMTLGVKQDDAVDQPEGQKKVVKAGTTETTVALALVTAMFAVFAWRMGVANMFGTMMATAHDPILNTVLFLMAVIIIAGAFTPLISDFGIVSIANHAVSRWRHICRRFRPRAIPTVGIMFQRKRSTMSSHRTRCPLFQMSALLLSVVLLTAGCAPEVSPSQEVPFVLPGSLIDNAEYASRRARLMDEVPDGVAIIPGATSRVADYQFFQNNDFLHFTGVDAPNAWLVVDGVNRASTLFLTLDEHDARGEGIPAELAVTPAEYTGIEQALPVEQMEGFLADLVGQVDAFCLSHRPEELHRMNTNEVYGAFRRTVMENPMDGRLTRELQLAERLTQLYPGVEVRDCFRTIQVLRKVKSPAEVELVREAARIGVAAHLEFMRATEVGMPERALAALFEFVSKREGAQELAYETIIMAGEHHPWGHYHRHDHTLQDGDFIILDAGPDYAYYNADISTTFPANGRFTPEQRELYELGLGIRQVCLDNYRAGT